MSQINAEYFKISPEIICIVNQSGIFLEVNPSWTSILGWSTGESLNRAFIDFLHPDDKNSTFIQFNEIFIIPTKICTSFESRYLHKDGGYRWLQWSATFLKGDQKSICIGRDITQNKRDSIFLNETEQASRVGSWELEIATNELFWSKMCHNIHETNANNFKANLYEWRYFFQFDTRNIFDAQFEDLIKNGTRLDLELPFVTAKGKKTWVRCIARATMKNGIVSRVFGTIEDVSIKKREKTKNELIIESGNYGTWDWDLETNAVYFNDRFCSMLGQDVNNIEHNLEAWDRLTHSEDKIQTYKDINDYLSGKSPIYRNIHRMKHSNGKWIWILDQGKIVERREGRPIRFSGTHTDITYIKELEEAQYDLVGRLRLIHAANKIGVWGVDLNKSEPALDDKMYEFSEIVWDDNMYELLGIDKKSYSKPQELWKNLIHPDDREKTINAVMIAIENNGDVEMNYRIILPNKEIRHILSKGFVERDNQGIPIKVSGISWDITQKIEQQNIFETIVTHIPIMIISYDSNKNIEWINTKCIETMGWNLEEMKKINSIGFKLFADEKQQIDILNFMSDSPNEWREFTLNKKDGNIAHTIWTNVKLSDSKYIGIGQDIGEKKRQEDLIKEQQAKIISSAKLSSLGEMASGIAHEINNPLAIIKGKAYQILKKLETGNYDLENLKKEITKIESTSQRIVNIIKGLRTFSRNGENDPFQKVHFRSVLNDVLELCNERFKHQGVKLKMTGDLDAIVICQETQMAQVLLNIINNAFDAVVDLEDPWVEIDVKAGIDTIKIRVNDSGPGIVNDIAQKIMQPFFTTKEVGVGTGLGLSISKGIIEMQGGNFYLDQNSSNTSFVIELPVSVTIH